MIRNGKYLEGFTLIEVLVALAVVTIGLGALWKGLGQEINVTRGLPDRIIAGWVAHNRVVLHQSMGQWPNTRTYTGTEFMGEKTWYWREQVSSTEEPLLRRITVSVGSDPQTLTLFTLEAFLHRPRPPVNVPGITSSPPAEERK